MSTDRGHTRGDYPRVCDVCGHRFMFSALQPIGELRFACADDAAGLTAAQISKFNARVKPIIVRPRKWAKDYVQTPIYQFSEAAIFNFIAEIAPKGERDGANDALAAAWAAIYMADIVIQEKRPMNWDRTARDVIERCLAYLLTLQMTDSFSHRTYGGGLTTDGLSTDTTLTVAAGIAFVKGYNATGEPAYLGAADLVAGHLRKIQCGDLKEITPTVYPGTSSPYRPGGLPSSVVIDDDAGMSNEYKLGDVVALQFMALLQEIRGDVEYAPHLEATGYTASPGGTLATMIEELTSFAVDGVAVTGETDPVSGLDVSELRVLYRAAQAGVSDSAAWDGADDGIPVREVALALSGLHYADQAAETITAVMAVLAASPAEDADEVYDATLCPATVLSENAPYPSASELYDWASLGLLSPILAATPATFKTSKDALSTARRFNSHDITAKLVGVDGLSTLEPRPITPTTSGTYDTSVVRAARAGLAYRQDPGRYPALRGN